MNLLIVQASPKKKGGTSRFLARLLRLFLSGVRKKTVSLGARQDFQSVLKLLPSVDAVCISAPLYVDGLPSHVVEFLSAAEEYCKSHHCRFKLYAVCNNGFVEGKQNLPALRMLQAWCEKTGVSWGGGIGIGGGVMLRVLGIVYPIVVGVILLQMALSCFSGGAVTGELWSALAVQICTWLFLNSGALYCLARLSFVVRRGRISPNRFTRVMVPAFVFVPVADVFMALSALFHGRFIFTLLKQDKWRKD